MDRAWQTPPGARPSMQLAGPAIAAGRLLERQGNGLSGTFFILYQGTAMYPFSFDMLSF